MRICWFVCVGGSAVGGHALKMFRLTVKWGWSVCIIAYNGNIQNKRSGRGWSSKGPRLRSCQPGAALFRITSFAYLGGSGWLFPSVNIPGARFRLAALFRCNLQSVKTTQSKLPNCINKTSVSRKNKGKQATINIFYHDFLYFYIIFRCRLLA